MNKEHDKFPGKSVSSGLLFNFKSTKKALGSREKGIRFRRTLRGNKNLVLERERECPAE